LHLSALLNLHCLPLLSLCLHLGALLGLGSLTLLGLGGLRLRPRLALRPSLRLDRLSLLRLDGLPLLRLGGLSLLRPHGLFLCPCLSLSALLRLGRLPLLYLLPSLPDLLLTVSLHVRPHALGLGALIELSLSLPRLLAGSAIGLYPCAELCVASGSLLARLRLLLLA
jgi:hypothetical protein